MFKGLVVGTFLGLVLQGYVSNIGKPGYIGIMATTCPPIRVTEVFHGTPAERAHLKKDDIILKVDGERGGEIRGTPGTPVTPFFLCNFVKWQIDKFRHIKKD
jgi:hypothetical protein